MSKAKTAITRTISTVVLIGLIGWVIFFAPRWLFGLIVAVFVGAGLHEFFTMVERKGIFLYRALGLIIGIIIPLSVHTGFEPTRGWELVLMVAALLGLFVLQLTRPDSSQTIVGIGTVLFGIFYISWCFTFIVKLRFIDVAGVDGRWLTAFLIFVTKAADIGAYVVGSAIGRHPLVARISPSKTWEGFLGGLAFGVGVAVLFMPHLPSVFAVGDVVALGLMLGVAGQLGDLSESMVKRDCQVKDSGGVFPGIGGVLDLVDSLLFTAPLCYFYLRYFVFS
ncbi:MAG: phosphatidate cytidylyltransferase [Candidatus Omnitrophica bacterium]|nr:phosphatidate cytidylyltransferase [Candidatus Omnitrophota bacterium]